MLHIPQELHAVQPVDAVPRPVTPPAGACLLVPFHAFFALIKKGRDLTAASLRLIVDFNIALSGFLARSPNKVYLLIETA